MDTLIKETTFTHDDADKQEHFRRAASDIVSQYNNDKHSMGATFVLDALSALQEKLTRGGTPAHKTKGWEQAMNAYKQIIQLYRYFDRFSKVKESEVQEGYFAFAVGILQAGLNMLHMQIAYECFMGREIELKEYVQKLDAKMLRPLISAICQEVKMEDGVEGREFGDMYQKLIRQIVRETLTKDQLKVFTAELMDFSAHLYLNCLHLPEDALKRINDVAKLVLDALDDPFTTTSDFDRVKSYIKRCGETFKQSGFPPSSRAADSSRTFMKLVLVKVGKRGLCEEMYNTVFDLVLDINKCPSDDQPYVLQLLSDVDYDFFRKLPKESLKKNPDLFVKVAKRYMEVIAEIDMKFFHNEKFAYNVVDDVLQPLYADNKQVVKHWVELLIPLLKRPSHDTVRAAKTVVGADKAIKWKEHPEIARQVFELICKFEPPEKVKETDDKEGKERKQKRKEFLDYFESMAKNFFEGLKKAKLLKDYRREMLTLSLKFMEMNDEKLFDLAESIAERIELNPKEDKEAMMDAMRRLHMLIKNEEHPWNDKWSLQRAANDLIDACLEPFKDGKIFTEDELKEIISICMTCLSYDCVNPDTGQFPSHYFSAYITMMKMLNKWLAALNRMDLAAPMIPRLLEFFEADDEHVTQLCSVYLYLIAQNSSGQKALAPYLDDLIKLYFEKEDAQLLNAIDGVYSFNPKALKPHFRALMDLLEETGEPQVISSLAQLFQKVSKIQAELFTDKDIEMLLYKAKESNTQTSLLEIPKELCKRRPESMIPHIDVLMDRSAWLPYVNYWITEMLVVLAVHKKEISPRVLDYLFDSVKSSQDKSVLITSLNAMRTIGFKYQDLLKPRRSEINGVQLTDVDAVNMRQLLLDMIDGKTSEDVLDQLTKQQQDIQSLVGRVDETEEAMAEVKDELGRQGEQLDNVKNEVNEQGQRLDQVETTVDETVAKVEEIDQKTLSHAPFWARDVSKLLNPVSEHDWRLLSSRLGYSNDDIRGWAQQADPCMAMLNEWYATRKTSEATYAILTQLQEMDRSDAAIIVENAMKNAEAVVEDEDFEYASPPPIFISYQWAHQPEVKLLKQHLEMAGYECWMDIGQMGGGDKLFEKIDNGIRAAKIIISCVTTKYAKSPNCNREVNLSVNLNKPIIPLLLEKCTWPPPGSMGPIFSEYLFIRFFQRQGEEVEDQRYWPKDKFQELLMQLNMFGLPPEEGKIDPEYKNWWLPMVEEIKIDKTKTKDGGQVVQAEQTEADKKAAESPDVFISYQWGKQKNIIKLYERLTSLGLSCWLDIKQMGGGDSLYDKIDKGVRGSRVVLSCVTQKYALSANCRREVSLADALKKPLLPLLLEQMAWPPSGPMSMVMTQLLYINFAKDESVQMTWDGPQFQELLSKIQEHVPQSLVRRDSKSSSSNEKPNQSSKEKANTSNSSTNQRAKSITGTSKYPPAKGSPSTPPSKGLQPQSAKGTTDSGIKPPAPSMASTRSYLEKHYFSKGSPSSSTSSSPAATAQPHSREKTHQPTNTARKPPLTKLSSVSKLATPSKSSPGSTVAAASKSKSEPPQLSVTSRRLLKPLSSDPPKPQPNAQIPPASKSTSRPSPSSQSRAATYPRNSQRPSRLPPLQDSNDNPANGQPSTSAGRAMKSSQPASNRVPPTQARKTNK